MFPAEIQGKVFSGAWKTNGYKSHMHISKYPGLNRREFLSSGLAATGALVCGAWAAPAASSEPEEKGLVGSNIYVWGQYAQRENRKLDVGEVVSALRDCGYDYLENFMDLARPEENARFAEQLKSKGLRPVSLYTGGRLHEADKAAETVDRILAACRVCKEAGFQVISCNPDPIGREKTDEELKTQVGAVARLGGELRSMGMWLGLHHHMPEMANGAREFRFNFDQTKPREVGFCYDVHWVWKGGVPPSDALKKYGDRVVTWHLRQSREGVWLEDLDTGDIDYSAVAAYAKEHHLPRRFTVELALENGTKVTRSVVENHKRSREFVRKVFQE